MSARTTTQTASSSQEHRAEMPAQKPGAPVTIATRLIDAHTAHIDLTVYADTEELHVEVYPVEETMQVPGTTRWDFTEVTSGDTHAWDVPVELDEGVRAHLGIRVWGVFGGRKQTRMASVRFGPGLHEGKKSAAQEKQHTFKGRGVHSMPAQRRKTP